LRGKKGRKIVLLFLAKDWLWQVFEVPQSTSVRG
jgi:hypothetical protein